WLCLATSGYHNLCTPTSSYAAVVEDFESRANHIVIRTASGIPNRFGWSRQEVSPLRRPLGSPHWSYQSNPSEYSNLRPRSPPAISSVAPPESGSSPRVGLRLRQRAYWRDSGSLARK